RRAARLGTRRPPGRRRRGRRLDPRRTRRARGAVGPDRAVRLPRRHRHRAPARRPGRRGTRPAPHARRHHRLLLGGTVGAESAHRPGQRRRTGPATASPGPRGPAAGQPAHLRAARRTPPHPPPARPGAAPAGALRGRAPTGPRHGPGAAFADGPAGLREARHVADAVAGTTAALDLPAVVRLRDVHLRGLVRLLRDDPEVQSFAERELDGLLSEPDEDLLSVLRTYLA